MPATEQLTISVDQETAEIIRSVVASGDYTDESALIEASIREVFSADIADHVLLREVAAVYDLMKANPGRGIPLEEARSRLTDRHKQFITGCKV